MLWSPARRLRDVCHWAAGEQKQTTPRPHSRYVVTRWYRCPELLLAPHLHSDGSPNRLLAWLGDGMHALLLDLFLHAAGPGLRAKFAHGEAALLPAASPPTDEGGEAEAGGEAGGEAGEAGEAGARSQ